MKLGLNVVVVAAEALVEVAVAAERLGYESVWAGEHVAFRADAHADITARYGGRPLYRPDSPFLDPLVTLSHLAAATTELRLGVGIFLLPLHEVLLTARAIATLDVLSGGRLDLGIGLGWYEPEFAALGVDFARRAGRTDEMIDALDVLFRDPAPEFHGSFVDFGPVAFEPKPLQRPRPRLHVGGNSRAAVERAARRGDGWYGAAAPASRLAGVVEGLRARRRELGRDGPFDVSTISLGRPPGRAELDHLGEVGVDRVVVTPFGDPDAPPFPGAVAAAEAISAIERYADSLARGA